MEYFLNISLGVASGIATYGIMWTLKVIATKAVIPKYLESIYQGYDVSGEWSGRVLDDNPDLYWEVSLDLKQSAHDIEGTYIAVKYVKNEKNSISAMTVKGYIWEGYVNLQCRSQSKKRLSFGSMLLKVEDQKLTGSQIFRQLGAANGPIMHRPVQLESKEATRSNQLKLNLDS